MLVEGQEGKGQPLALQKQKTQPRPKLLFMMSITGQLNQRIILFTVQRLRNHRVASPLSLHPLLSLVTEVLLQNLLQLLLLRWR